MMTTGTLRIGGREFWIVADADYRGMRAALQRQEKQARVDAGDVAESRRRMAQQGGRTLSEVRKRLGL